MSRAAVARVESVSWHTADRWPARASQLAQRFNDRYLYPVLLRELQADELRTFAPNKTRAAWVFTSVEVNSPLRVSTVVGRRSYNRTRKLLTDALLRGEIPGTLLIVTDGFKCYKPIICKLFGLA